MGFYKWSNALVYSGQLAQLDGSQACACVKMPKLSKGNEEVQKVAGQTSEMLTKAVQERLVRMGRLSSVSDDDSENILAPTDKLQYIPKFGYLCVSMEKVKVETKNRTVIALVGTRVKSLKGEHSNFYLFPVGEDESSECWTGKIGKMVVHLTPSTADERSVYHFEIISY